MVCSLWGSVCSNVFSDEGVSSILLDSHDEKEKGKLSPRGIGEVVELPLGVTCTPYSLSKSLSTRHAIKPWHPQTFERIYPALGQHAKKINQWEIKVQEEQPITGIKRNGAEASLTSQVHLVCRSPVGFLFAFIAGDRGIFEGAPIRLVAFQRQLLGPARQVEGCYIWFKLLNQAAAPGNSFHP